MLPACVQPCAEFCRALNNANSALWVNVAFISYLSVVMVIELVEDVLCLKTFPTMLTFFSSSSCSVMLVSLIKEACCMIWPLVNACNSSQMMPAEGAEGKLVSLERLIWVLKDSLKSKSRGRLELSLHLWERTVLLC